MSDQCSACSAMAPHLSNDTKDRIVYWSMEFTPTSSVFARCGREGNIEKSLLERINARETCNRTPLQSCKQGEG